MNLTALEIFEAAVRTGSFRAAAAEAGCSQSTASFHIRALEEHFNFILFERIGRSVRPTEKALEILPAVREVLAARDRLDLHRRGGQRLSGTVRLGAPEHFAAFRLQGVIRRFREAAPGVTLMIEDGTSYSLRDRVLDGSLDLAVTFNCNGYGAPLTTLPLDSYPLALIGSAGLEIPEGAFTAPGGDAGVSLISADFGNGPSRFFQRFADRAGIRLGTPMQADGMEALRALLAGGFGVTYMPRYCFEKELRGGTLKEIPTALGEVDLGILLLKNSRRAESAAVGLLSRIIRSELLNPGLNTEGFLERTCLMHRREEPPAAEA